MTRPATLTDFAARLDRLASGGLAAAIRPVLVRGALDIERQAKTNATASPQVRTGRLRASIGAVVGTHGGMAAIIARAGGVGSRGPVPYATLQEKGGVVVPRVARMLRIPLAPALTRAGVDRYPTPLRQSAPDSFAIVRHEGQAFLMKTKGTGKGLFWYVLKRSVVIPARPFLRPAVDLVLARTIRPALSQAVVRAMMTDSGPRAVP